MTRKKTKTNRELSIGKLEFVFEKGFERDWANVLATIIYRQLKAELNMEE